MRIPMSYLDTAIPCHITRDVRARWPPWRLDTWELQAEPTSGGQPKATMPSP